MMLGAKFLLLTRYINKIQIEVSWFFLFCFSFLAMLLTDGRGLRHKYFKDYKDYLGRWGNVDNLKARTVTESGLAPICLT